MIMLKQIMMANIIVTVMTMVNKAKSQRKTPLFQSFQNQTVGMTAILTSGEGPGGMKRRRRRVMMMNIIFIIFWKVLRTMPMMIIVSGEYKEECGTCALIAEGSTMPYSDNTCPQVTKMLIFKVDGGVGTLYLIITIVIVMMIVWVPSCHGRQSRMMVVSIMIMISFSQKHQIGCKIMINDV